MKRSTLIKALDIGVQNKGTGGYLQRGNIKKVNSKWQIEGENIDNNKPYQIVGCN